MDKNRIRTLIEKFNSGNPDKQELSEIEKLIESGAIMLEDLSSLKELKNGLDKLSIPEPDSSLDKAFYAMLSQRIRKKDNNIFNLLINRFNSAFAFQKIGYAAVLLLIGFIAGFLINSSGNKKQINVLTAEIKQMHEMLMVNLLEKPGATDRLKAVNLTDKMADVDDAVIYALLKTLNHDENINVRLATIDALFKYADHNIVRQGLVESLTYQDSPIVLVTLADILVKLQEKSSVNEFKSLLKKNDLDEAVRKKIEDSIKKIS